MTVHVTDHVTRGVARLIERYRLPHTSALLAAWLTEVQAAEDAFWQLMVERSVGTATGATLDILGRIVDEPRDNREDDMYRLWIAARTMVSRSSGTPEQLIAIARKLSGDAPITLTEYYPAAFDLRVDGIDPDVGWEIADMIVAAKPAGVRAFFSWSDGSFPGATFTFAPGDEPIPSSPLGFDAGHFEYVTDGTLPVPPPVPPTLAFDGVLGFDEAVLG